MEKFKYYFVLQCNTMETVTVKFQEDILKKIDKGISKHNFNSRTEFVREAVRDKLFELNKENLINEFLKFRGKAKKKLSDKEFNKNRIEASKEIEKILDREFNLS